MFNGLFLTIKVLEHLQKAPQLWCGKKWEKNNDTLNARVLNCTQSSKDTKKSSLIKYLLLFRNNI